MDDFGAGYVFGYGDGVVGEYHPPTERPVGALIASDASAHVMTEAMRSMVEAWFLLAQISPQGSLLERSEQAVEVLEQGIADLKVALNEGPEPA